MESLSYDKLKAELEALASNYPKDRSSLLPIAQEVQLKYHCVSRAAMHCISEILSISVGEVNSVVSFYAFLNEKYHGRFVIRLCRTLSCDMANVKSVAQQLRLELGVSFGETTPDDMFTLQWASCLGMCDLSPAMLINDEVFTRVSPDTIHSIIEACRYCFSVQPLAYSAGGGRW